MTPGASVILRLLHGGATVRGEVPGGPPRPAAPPPERGGDPRVDQGGAPGGEGAIQDPYVSFDGEWVYFAKFHDALGHKGSDIYTVHVPSRR